MATTLKTFNNEVTTVTFISEVAQENNLVQALDRKVKNALTLTQSSYVLSARKKNHKINF